MDLQATGLGLYPRNGGYLISTPVHQLRPNEKFNVLQFIEEGLVRRSHARGRKAELQLGFGMLTGTNTASTYLYLTLAIEIAVPRRQFFSSFCRGVEGNRFMLQA